MSHSTLTNAILNVEPTSHSTFHPAHPGHLATSTSITRSASSSLTRTSFSPTSFTPTDTSFHGHGEEEEPRTPEGMLAKAQGSMKTSIMAMIGSWAGFITTFVNWSIEKEHSEDEAEMEEKMEKLKEEITKKGGVVSGGPESSPGAKAPREGAHRSIPPPSRQTQQTLQPRRQSLSPNRRGSPSRRVEQEGNNGGNNVNVITDSPGLREPEEEAMIG